MVELLLRSGAKVDYRPDTDEAYPRTTLCDEPLRLAIRNKHIQIARMLLEHGADPNKRCVLLKKKRILVKKMRIIVLSVLDPNL